MTSSRHGIDPKRRCASSSPRGVPGTATEAGPMRKICVVSLSNGTSTAFIVAGSAPPLGTVTKKSSSRVERSRARCTSMNPPPPAPVRSDSVTHDANPAATAASTALPPSASTRAPTSAVTGCPAAIAPRMLGRQYAQVPAESFRLVARTGHPDFLDLPWSRPLAEWESPRFVDVARGIHRHVVRFVDYDGALYALKELPPRLAAREYRLLRALGDLGLPSVQARARVPAPARPRRPRPACLRSRRLGRRARRDRRSGVAHALPRVLAAVPARA